MNSKLSSELTCENLCDTQTESVCQLERRVRERPLQFYGRVDRFRVTASDPTTKRFRTFKRAHHSNFTHRPRVPQDRINAPHSNSIVGSSRTSGERIFFDVPLYFDLRRAGGGAFQQQERGLDSTPPSTFSFIHSFMYFCDSFFSCFLSFFHSFFHPFAVANGWKQECRVSFDSSTCFMDVTSRLVIFRMKTRTRWQRPIGCFKS